MSKENFKTRSLFQMACSDFLDALKKCKNCTKHVKAVTVYTRKTMIRIPQWKSLLNNLFSISLKIQVSP